MTPGQTPLEALGWVLGEIITDVEHVIASGDAGYIDRDMLDDYRKRAEAIGAAAAAQPREQVIARLAAAFGPHKAAVSRKPDEDHRHPWTEFVPSGDDERGSTMIVFRDTDGRNSMRPLTYGEVADALCSVADAAAAQPAPGVLQRLKAILYDVTLPPVEARIRALRLLDDPEVTL